MTWQTGANLAVIVQTVLVAISAGFVIYQLRDARRVRAEISRPYVVVDLDNRGQRVDLVIRNIGQSPAVDVRVAFDPAPTAQSDDLGEVVAMLRDEGITFLAPGREIRFFYGVAHVLLDGQHTTRFTAMTSFKRGDGVEGSKRITDPPVAINLERLRHMLTATPAEDKVVNHLEIIAKSLRAVAGDVRILADLASGDDSSQQSVTNP